MLQFSSGGKSRPVLNFTWFYVVTRSYSSRSFLHALAYHKLVIYQWVLFHGRMHLWNRFFQKIFDESRLTAPTNRMERWFKTRLWDVGEIVLLSQNKLTGTTERLHSWYCAKLGDQKLISAKLDPHISSQKWLSCARLDHAFYSNKCGIVNYMIMCLSPSTNIQNMLLF